MLTLSIQQPWAWLIVNGHKDVENRTWSTRVRGMIRVHAGQKFDKEGYEWIRHEFPGIALPEPSEFERGGIVGRVRIIGCVERMESPWFFGPFGFALTEGQSSTFMPCKGKLGFFKVEGESTLNQ